VRSRLACVRIGGAGLSRFTRAAVIGLLAHALPLVAEESAWRVGAFGDLGYLRDFNEPANHVFRSRGTAFHLNAWALNMAGAYARKGARGGSRFGTELTLHAGKDAEVFGFSATAPNLGGSKWLRHLGPTNVSWLAPAGRGLTLQAGIFGSVIGYDALYAKDNFNYTRPWGADFTPYLMLGLNASYPFSDSLSGTVVLVNGYWHLANANSVPSTGAQLAWKATPRTTLKQTILFGPHQSNTSLALWRWLSDSIAEWKAERVTLAFEYQAASERVDAAGRPRAWWMSAQLPARWSPRGRFSLAVRPEVAWDSDGRWTLARQTVKAFTTTLEYRVAYRRSSATLRVEHRLDDSRGPEGGFFRNGLALTPRQQLLVFGLIVRLDGP
jgi:putative OmpL-like beta-barrel porin-2